ncbi:putative bifunctional diguanylate cyclase/phosphodiesterase [Marinicella sp. W31]|uniref:putative bifunctional diguanylate cyclase/phosphodiesterase n=1 Tax=Marinicella sp. W31 TaxID=3023713 RepID=UPI0037573B65
MAEDTKKVLIGAEKITSAKPLIQFLQEKNEVKTWHAGRLSEFRQILKSASSLDYVVVMVGPKWIEQIQEAQELFSKDGSSILIGLFAKDCNLPTHERKGLENFFNYSFSLPLTKHKLNKDFSEIAEPEQILASQESDSDLWHKIFYQSQIAKLLINARDQNILEANHAFMNRYPTKSTHILNLPWYKNSVDSDSDRFQKFIDQVNTDGKGQINLVLNKNFTAQAHLKIHFCIIRLEARNYYLAEIEDLTEKAFQVRVFNQLKAIQEIDFTDMKDNRTVAQLVRWYRLDICCAIGRGEDGGFNQIEWDFSKSGLAELFVNSNHDFLLKKLEVNKSIEIEKLAFKHIPSDEFLHKTKTDMFLAYRCQIDDENDQLLIFGGPVKHEWGATTLIYGQLASQYTKFLTYNKLKQSHDREYNHDALTGLANRRSITNKIEACIERCRENKDFFAVLFLDLDRFKVINDSLGHDVGDMVLQSIAEKLRKNVQGFGVASRYAGDEFLILLNRIESIEVIKNIANRILKEVADPISLQDGSEIQLTISIGAAIYPDHGQSTFDLIKKADVALYDSKLKGKNRLSVYKESGEGEQAKVKEEMESNLLLALENKELEVYYQPKINAETEDIAGFEALIRWIHPELGLISPGLFIPIAEHSGLINKIGYYVIEKACESLQQWQNDFELKLSMSVNLSPVQLDDGNLIKQIKDVISSKKINPDFLDFEITESEKIKNQKNAFSMFKNIVEIGCSLSIDDFGTGHSSFDYIKKIPAKTLKIDQSFVKNIGLSPDDEAIVEATVNMAKRLGHQLVAEGVETEEQRQYLKSRGCEYFQGYLFCRPLPKQEITSILERRRQLLEKNAA